MLVVVRTAEDAHILETSETERGNIFRRDAREKRNRLGMRVRVPQRAVVGLRTVTRHGMNANVRAVHLADRAHLRPGFHSTQWRARDTVCSEERVCLVLEPIGVGKQKVKKSIAGRNKARRRKLLQVDLPLGIVKHGTVALVELGAEKIDHVANRLVAHRLNCGNGEILGIPVLEVVLDIKTNKLGLPVAHGTVELVLDIQTLGLVNVNVETVDLVKAVVEPVFRNNGRGAIVQIALGEQTAERRLGIRGTEHLGVVDRKETRTRAVRRRVPAVVLVLGKTNGLEKEHRAVERVLQRMQLDGRQHGQVGIGVLAALLAIDQELLDLAVELRHHDIVALVNVRFVDRVLGYAIARHDIERALMVRITGFGGLDHAQVVGIGQLHPRGLAPFGEERTIPLACACTLGHDTHLGRLRIPPDDLAVRHKKRDKHVLAVIVAARGRKVELVRIRVTAALDVADRGERLDLGTGNGALVRAEHGTAIHVRLVEPLVAERLDNVVVLDLGSTGIDLSPVLFVKRHVCRLADESAHMRFERCALVFGNVVHIAFKHVGGKRRAAVKVETFGAVDAERFLFLLFGSFEKLGVGNFLVLEFFTEIFGGTAKFHALLEQLLFKLAVAVEHKRMKLHLFFVVFVTGFGEKVAVDIDVERNLEPTAFGHDVHIAFGAVIRKRFKLLLGIHKPCVGLNELAANVLVGLVETIDLAAFSGTLKLGSANTQVVRGIERTQIVGALARVPQLVAVVLLNVAEQIKEDRFALVGKRADPRLEFAHISARGINSIHGSRRIVFNPINLILEALNEDSY